MVEPETWHCDIAGVVLAVRARPDVAARVRALLPVRDGRREPVATVEIGDDEIAMPARPPDRIEPVAEVWWTDDGVLVRHAIGVTGSSDATAAVVGLTAPDERLWRALQWVMPAVLSPLLTHHGRFVIHAAVVAGRGGAALVLGGSGAGKSTTSLAALDAGLDVHGDDLAVVTGGSSSLLVGALPRPLNVPVDAGDPPSGGVQHAADLRRRWEIAVAPLDPVPLTHVLLVGHGNGTTALTPLDGGAIVAAVLEGYASSRDLRRRQALFPIAVQVARLEHHQLLLGVDPGERRRTTGTLLRNLLG